MEGSPGCPKGNAQIGILRLGWDESQCMIEECIIDGCILCLVDLLHIAKTFLMLDSCYSGLHADVSYFHCFTFMHETIELGT